MAKLPEREIKICRRIRVFREALRISRAQFAIAVGIGSERLASYESGRAPIRYETFAAINEKFFLNPAWLAEGSGSAASKSPFDDSPFHEAIHPRDLFSTAYDNVLKSHLDNEAIKTTEIVNELISKTEQLMQMRRNVLRRIPSEQWSRYFESGQKLLEEISRLKEFDQKIKKASSKKTKLP